MGGCCGVPAATDLGIKAEISFQRRAPKPGTSSAPTRYSTTMPSADLPEAGVPETPSSSRSPRRQALFSARIVATANSVPSGNESFGSPTTQR